LLRAFLVLTLAAVLGAPAFAGDRYELDTGGDLALGASTALAGLWVWQRAERVAPLSAAELADLRAADLPAFDRMATRQWSPGAMHLSDGLRLGLTLAPLALLLDTGPRLSGGELLVMYLQTMGVTEVLTGAVKLGVGRVRPLAYNPDPRIPDDLRQSRYARRSFPSGHTSAAFAGAVFTGEVYARLHPDRQSRHWVRGGGLALAALTGYARVRAGHHFPSDVLAGAALGALVGWVVPWAHERDLDPARLDAPGEADGAPMIALRLAW
jgi:membrane-associated phospholipid phosphatase